MVKFGPGHRNTGGRGTEHEVHGVEHLFEEDAEPEGRQGQEHAG